jgi:hypothetical protein
MWMVMTSREENAPLMEVTDDKVDR